MPLTDGSALETDKALEEISRKKGTLYDPRVVRACVKPLRDSTFTFQEVGRLTSREPARRTSAT